MAKFTVQLVYEDGTSVYLSKLKEITNDESKAFHFKNGGHRLADDGAIGSIAKDVSWLACGNCGHCGWL